MLINCLTCKHFYVTWDPEAPRGCKKYGFKSSQMPSVLVYKETKEKCLSYSPKPDIKKDSNKKVIRA